ncbi:MAG: hypothetical protein PF692_00045 [Kiritimatiellae bacterium]|nr:hypothetical protein [Kiritimatiellia bacterium]
MINITNNKEGKKFRMRPHILFCILTISIFVAFHLKVCPKFISIYADLGLTLPLATKIVTSWIYIPFGIFMLLIPAIISFLTKRNFISRYCLVILGMLAFATISLILPLDIIMTGIPTSQ